MKSLLCTALVLCCTLARGQTLDVPLPLERVAPAPRHAADPAESPMLAQPSTAGTLLEWYAQQKRPPLVVYFDKRLDQLPPGWRGSKRLLIEENTKAGGREENRKLTVGVQHNTQPASSARNEFITLFEQSLQQEMRRQQFKVLDSTVLHRRLAAGNKSEDTDLEYESLRKSARFVFEVQLLVLNGQVDLMANLKDIHTGDFAASLRLPVEEVLDSAAAMDVVSRQLVRQLLRQKAPG
jgi:hypothetical protein